MMTVVIEYFGNLSGTPAIWGGNLHSSRGVVTVAPTNIPYKETYEGYGQTR